MIGADIYKSHIILKRKRVWLGHVLRKDELFKLLIEGRMLRGKGYMDRNRTDMISDIMGNQSYGNYKAMCRRS